MKGEVVRLKERVGEGQGILCRRVQGLFSDSNGVGFDGFAPLLGGTGSRMGVTVFFVGIFKKGDKGAGDGSVNMPNLENESLTYLTAKCNGRRV